MNLLNQKEKEACTGATCECLMQQPPDDITIVGLERLTTEQISYDQCKTFCCKDKNSGFFRFNKKIQPCKNKPSTQNLSPPIKLSPLLEKMTIS